MKRIIIFTLLCALTLGLCACKPNERAVGNQFTIFKTEGNGITNQKIRYMYDNDTKVVYLYTYGGSHATMCPYYIIVDGAPTLAIYGVNYMEDK